MRKKGIHIAIEGMDGVGKTTTSQKLSKRLGFKFIEKPLHYIFDREGDFKNYIKIRDYFNSQKNDDILRAWFYGLGNIFTVHNFYDKNIITDRHLISNYFWCGSDKTEMIFKNLINLISIPDYTFLLTTTKEEAMKRMKKRDSNDSDLSKVKLYDEFMLKSEKFLQKYNIPYKIIDSTNLNVNDVVNSIMETLIKNNIIER